MADKYFETEHFKQLLHSYEDDMANNRPVYMEADDFADIGDYYLSANRPEAAETVLNQGLALYPEDEMILLVLNSCLIFQRRFDKAEDQLKKLDPDTPDAIYQQGQIAFAKYNNITEAEAKWHQWIDRVHEDDSSDDALRDCYVHIIASYLELVEPSDTWQEEHRGCDPARRWIELYIQRFQPLGDNDYDSQLAELITPASLSDMLVEVLKQVLERNPYLNGGWTRIARAYVNLEQYEEALEAADFALAINESDLDSLLTKAHVLQMMDENKASIPYFEKYIDCGGDKTQIIPLASAYLSIKNTEKGLSWAKALIDQLESENRRYTNTKEEDKPQADFYQSVYGGFPEYYTRCMIDLSTMFLNNDFSRLALNSAMRALKYRRGDSDIFFHIGECLLHTGRIKTSSKAFELAFRYSSDPVWTCLRISMSFSQVDADEMSKQLIRLALTLSESTPPSSEVLCKAYLMQAIIGIKTVDKQLFIEAINNIISLKQETATMILRNIFPSDVPPSKWEEYAEEHFDIMTKRLRDVTRNIGGL